MILEFHSGFRARNVLCGTNNDWLAGATSQPPQFGCGAARHPESCQGCHSAPSSNRTSLLKDLSDHPPNMAARVIPGCLSPRPHQPPHGWPASNKPPPFPPRPSSPVLAPSAPPSHAIPAPAFIWQKGPTTFLAEAPMPTKTGERGWGEIIKGSFKTEQSRNMRREPGERADSGGSADLWARPEPGGSGVAEGRCGALRGTRQAAGPKPGARGNGPPPPRPRLPNPAPPHPTRCPGGAAPSVLAAPARLGASPARTPPAPGPAAPPPGRPPPQAGGEAPPAALPAPRLTSAALRTNGRAGGPARSASAAARGGAGSPAPTLLSASSGRREPQGAARQPHHASGRPRTEGRGGRRVGARETGARRRAGGSGFGGRGEARPLAGTSQDRRRLTAPRRSLRSSACSRRRRTPPGALPLRVTSARPGARN